MGSLLWRLGDRALVAAFRVGGFFVAWFLSCFALAAVATVVGRLNREEEGAWDGEVYERARARVWRLLSGAALTFLSLVMGLAVTMSIELALFFALRKGSLFRFNYFVTLIVVVLVTSAMSWQGLMFPMLVWDDVGPWRAMRRSYALAAGYRAHLASLVSESLLASYLAGLAVYYVFGFVAQRLAIDWAGWLIFVAAILAAAAAEAPMFIGFSTLYCRLSIVGSAYPKDSLPPDP